MDVGEVAVRQAGVEDVADAARLLHDFNAEYDEPTPEAPVLAEHLRRLLAGGEIVLLLAGEGPDGVAQLRLFTSIWSGEPDAYLAELYVVPERRGQGVGRALLDAAIETVRAAGATHIELTTGEDDVEARSLYESSGFTNLEGGDGGPRMLYYERDL